MPDDNEATRSVSIPWAVVIAVGSILFGGGVTVPAYRALAASPPDTPARSDVSAIEGRVRALEVAGAATAQHISALDETLVEIRGDLRQINQKLDDLRAPGGRAR